DVYYISEDAVLSRVGSGIDEVTKVEDLAGKRIGVQRGTIFESWLTTSLVDTGLTDATNLFAYTGANLAVNDLKRGRVDAVVMDLEPAKSFIGNSGLRLVAEGLNREMFAIAVPKGQRELLGLINRSLDELKTENVIADLVQQYVGQDTADQAPLPTPSPPPCVDAMAYVSDLTFDDSVRVPVVPRGQPFQKGWRVRNAGTCPWTPGYALTFAGGDQMGGVSAQIVREVAPGAAVDLYVNLTAPTTPGKFRGFWQMKNDQAVPFGERIWVSIETPAPAPPPTATPVPSRGTFIDFRAGRTNIRQGECVDIGWNVQNASAVYFYREGTNWQDNPAIGQEKRNVCPQFTTKYYLRVVRPDGGVEMREIVINVQPVANPPVIAMLDTVPPGTMPADQCTTVRWDVQGDARSVIVTRNGVTIWNAAPLRASLQDCPPPGRATYQVEAQGPGGTTRRSVDLTVNSR
ncbi:MAG: transporter substrate-binding domain-containing protein, partial [Anaerolineae bacterium]|nr:transporter substrate-binding domain-containing protein [Anaerolineae bacterium]